MKYRLLIIVFLVLTFTTYGQKKTDNSYFTWEDFVDGFGREMVFAEDVFNNMAKNGLKNNTMTKMDFTFVSDKKENLLKLSNFLKKHYPYSVEEVQRSDEL